MKWDISCDFASGFGIVDFAHEIAWLILKVQDRRVVKHSVAYVISRSSGNRLLPMFDMNIIKINGIGIWRNHTIQKCCIENRMWWLWCKCNAEVGECFFPGQIMWPGEIPRYILCTVFTEYLSKSVSWIHAVVISLRDNPYGEIVTVTSKGLLLKEWRCTLWTS